jgi:hypothetical protein
MASTKYLITFQIQDGDQFRLRSVLSSLHVEQSDAEFYYHELLGFQSYKVQVACREVPDSFTVGLLGATTNEIPVHFPAHDMETDENGLKKYYTLLERVCEMETMRAEYGIATVQPTKQEPVFVSEKPSAPSKYMSWVEEVMAAFRSTMETEPYNPLDQDITFAWMYTPVLKEIRETRGSRVITNLEVGRTWATRLGTEVFPDLLISRRFSTADWKFQHPLSDVLAKQAVHWYLASQMLGESAMEGVSPWILQADEDLAAVLSPFKQVGPQQSFAASMSGSTDREKKDKPHPLTNILRKLEGDHILSALTHDGIIQLPQELWERYLRHVFKAFGVGTNIVETCWGPALDTIQVWMRGNQGVRTDRPALVASWQIWWEIMVQPAPTQERFAGFLYTLDGYDPIVSISFTSSKWYDLATEWIKLYVDTEMEYAEDSKIPALAFYNNVRQWCLKYVTLPTLDSAFKAMHIASVMSTLRYTCKKTKSGRMFLNLRYKHAQPPVQAEPAAGPSVLSIMRDAAETDFTVIARDEIHLGTL